MVVPNICCAHTRWNQRNLYIKIITNEQTISTTSDLSLASLLFSSVSWGTTVMLPARLLFIHLSLEVSLWPLSVKHLCWILDLRPELWPFNLNFSLGKRMKVQGGSRRIMSSNSVGVHTMACELKPWNVGKNTFLFFIFLTCNHW